MELETANAMKVKLLLLPTVILSALVQIAAKMSLLVFDCLALAVVMGNASLMPQEMAAELASRNPTHEKTTWP